MKLDIGSVLFFHDILSHNVVTLCCEEDIAREVVKYMYGIKVDIQEESESNKPNTAHLLVT